MRIFKEITITKENVLGYGITILGEYVVVGDYNGKPFTTNFQKEDYESLKKAIEEEEAENFLKKDLIYCKTNGYTEVYVRTKFPK